MSDRENQRSTVVEFVKSYYEHNGDAPSVSKTLGEIGLNRSAFYRLFPRGLSEVCKLAGITVPEERVQAVQQALKGRIISREKQASIQEQSSQQYLKLSPDATNRVYGICQLEGGDSTRIGD